MLYTPGSQRWAPTYILYTPSYILYTPSYVLYTQSYILYRPGSQRWTQSYIPRHTQVPGGTHPCPLLVSRIRTDPGCHHRLHPSLPTSLRLYDPISGRRIRLRHSHYSPTKHEIITADILCEKSRELCNLLLTARPAPTSAILLIKSVGGPGIIK